MDLQAHWQGVYTTKAPDAVSWYRPHLERSLGFVQALAPDPDARIVDVGGGASTLVDDLLAAGYRDLAVIDLAEAALATARARLGPRGDRVRWIAGDATTPLLAPGSVALWHDRAVFHFLTTEAERRAYVTQVRRAVRPGGHVVLATFAEDGPERCSGLPVCRYAPDALHAVFGEGFTKIGEDREVHTTPGGSVQAFAYCLCVRE